MCLDDTEFVLPNVYRLLYGHTVATRNMVSIFIEQLLKDIVFAYEKLKFLRHKPDNSSSQLFFRRAHCGICLRLTLIVACYTTAVNTEQYFLYRLNR